MSSNKSEQLGMNHSTASARLVKDILFKFISEKKILCYRCSEQLDRDNFSIEHIEPWLDSPNPRDKFFDLDNITFSHLRCNCIARRRPEKLSEDERRIRRNKSNAKSRLKTYCPKKRRERYVTKGY